MIDHEIKTNSKQSNISCYLQYSPYKAALRLPAAGRSCKQLPSREHHGKFTSSKRYEYRTYVYSYRCDNNTQYLQWIMVPSSVADQELQILRSTATETIAIRETKWNPTSRRARSACNVSRGLSSLRFKGSKVSADLPRRETGGEPSANCSRIVVFSTNKCLYALNILNSRHNGMNLKGKEVQFSLGTSMLLMSPPAFVK